MKKNKVEVVGGAGMLERGGRLTVKAESGKSRTFTYKDMILATGARPRSLPGLEIDGETVHSSRTILENKRLPQKLLVVGAGAIGIEFAYFFQSLGAQVTVVEMLDQILPVEDAEVARELKKLLKKQGVTVYTGTKAQIKKAGKTVTAVLESKQGQEKWSGDCCLVAVGVLPNTDNIGLADVGIELNRGFIKVDEYLRTNIPHHFAIGDVAGPPLLAHKASHEGIIAAEAACGQAHQPMRYDNIPSCTYCQPQVASIGLTEEAAAEKGLKYRTAKIPFSAVGKAIAIDEPQGFLKVIIDEDVGEVLGVHIIHSEATELISEAAVVRSHEGVAASVVETIHPHPTLSEAFMEAMALALKRPINF